MNIFFILLPKKFDEFFIQILHSGFIIFRNIVIIRRTILYQQIKF
jgi:hypothetical protein